jgi:hypothetical protein
MFANFKHRTPIHLVVSSEHNSGNESFELIEEDDWHLSGNIGNSPMMRSMRSQSPPVVSDPAVNGPAQSQVYEEPDEEQDAETGSHSQMHSDQHQPDEVWREYHPLLTGK